MRELPLELTEWHDGGTPFALATVVAVRGSAPRAPGAVLTVAGRGSGGRQRLGGMRPAIESRVACTQTFQYRPGRVVVLDARGG